MLRVLYCGLLVETFAWPVGKSCVSRAVRFFALFTLSCAYSYRAYYFVISSRGVSGCRKVLGVECMLSWVLVAECVSVCYA